MSLLTADYDYQLPDELIARYPAERRDESRMLVLHRAGALLFRGFGFAELSDFEEFAQVFSPPLALYTGGASPRKKGPGLRP